MASNCKNSVICNNHIWPKRPPHFQKVIESLYSSSSSMISNFDKNPVFSKIFLSSDMIFKVCGCNSPVEQSSGYNPNWSYLIVSSLTIQGQLYPLTGGAEILCCKISSRFSTKVCAIRSVKFDSTKRTGQDLTFTGKVALLFQNFLFSTTS